MRRLIISIFIVACMMAIANTFVIAQEAPAPIIVNGSFETPNLNGWQQGLAGVDLVAHWQAAAGDHSIDLNATSGAGSVTQTIATEVDASYILRFAMSANIGGPEVNDMTVSIGSAETSFTYTVGAEHTLGNMLWVYHTIPFTATEETTTIVFTSLVPNGAGGPAIDDVSVERDSICQMIANGSFEIPNLNGWQQGLAGVDLVAHWQAAAGDHSIDLNATSGAGSVTQTIATEVDATYTLRFAMSANIGGPEVNDMTVSIGSEVTNFTYTLGAEHTLGNMLWEYHTISFTATERSTTIVFTSLVPTGAGGPALDDVMVYPGIRDIGFTRDNLVGTTWEFLRADGSQIAAAFVLNADGTIGSYSNPNENHWAFGNGTLVIYTMDNIPSTCFTSATREGTAVTLNGSFLLDPSLQITHGLRLVTP